MLADLQHERVRRLRRKAIVRKGATVKEKLIAVPPLRDSERHQVHGVHEVEQKRVTVQPAHERATELGPIAKAGQRCWLIAPLGH